MRTFALSLYMSLMFASAAHAAQCVKIIAVGGNRMPVDGPCASDATPAPAPVINVNVTNVNNNVNNNNTNTIGGWGRQRHPGNKWGTESNKEAERQRNDKRKAKDDHDKKCRGIGEAAGCDLENPGLGWFNDERKFQEEDRKAKDDARREADKAKSEERRAQDDARKQAERDRRESEYQARKAERDSRKK